MFLTNVRGVIDRRILVNYRVDPERLEALLPAPFRPQLVNGYGMAGICLIRLKQIRPSWAPSSLGIGSENAAHRIAVQWDSVGQTHSGVYIPRRDSSSRLNVLAGGRLFPGQHHRAIFRIEEADDQYQLEMQSIDGESSVHIKGCAVDRLPPDSVFGCLSEASSFYQAGSLGYSPNEQAQSFDGIELRTLSWHVQPFEVEQMASSFFDNQRLFPQGTIEFDNALLMRNIKHQWHLQDSLSACAVPVGVA